MAALYVGARNTSLYAPSYVPPTEKKNLIPTWGTKAKYGLQILDVEVRLSLAFMMFLDVRKYWV